MPITNKITPNSQTMDRNPIIGFTITIKDNATINIPKAILNARIHPGVFSKDMPNALPHY
jgi:hypothetical protein